eukprot:941945-Prorocentrum_minimum.AAC.5
MVPSVAMLTTRDTATRMTSSMLKGELRVAGDMVPFSRSSSIIIIGRRRSARRRLFSAMSSGKLECGYNARRWASRSFIYNSTANRSNLADLAPSPIRTPHRAYTLSAYVI